MELNLRRVFCVRVCGKRPGATQQTRPPAHIAVHWIARQHAGDDFHDVAHAAVDVELTFYVLFAQCANFAGLEPCKTGPAGEVKLDRSVGRADNFSFRKLQCNRGR